MNNKLKLIAGSALAIATTAIVAVSSFAQTVTPVVPVMDADVQNQATSTVTGIVAALSANFLIVLTVGGGILVTIMGVYFLLKHFKRIVHS